MASWPPLWFAKGWACIRIVRSVVGRRIGPGGRAELGDVGVAVPVGVVHEEPAVLGEARVEGEAQESLLAPRGTAPGP